MISRARLSIERRKAHQERGAPYDDDDKLGDSDREPGRIFQTTLAYQSNVVAAIFTSVAFLEASINEVFLDAVHSTELSPGQIIPFGSVRSLSPDIVERVAQKWGEIERKSTLKKYNWTLKENNKKEIDASDPKGYAVDTLIKFRHSLMHAKPEWVSTQVRNESLRPGKNNTVLESRVNALIKSDANRPRAGYAHKSILATSQFPANCLNAPLARMAVKSCLEFDAEFCHRMRIKNKEIRSPAVREALLFLDC